MPVDSVQGSAGLRGSQAVNGGHYVLLPGFSPSDVTSPMVFHDAIAIRVEVFDPAVGQHDGDGIKGIKFTIRSGKKVVAETTETTPEYCAFGGDTACYVWKFSEHDKRWPSGAKVNGGLYTLEMLIVSNSDKSALWTWSFRVQPPE